MTLNWERDVGLPARSKSKVAIWKGTSFAHSSKSKSQHVANNLKLVSQEGLERLGRLIRLSTRDLRIACVFWEYPVPQRPEPCPSHFHRSSNCLRQRPSFTLGAGFASKLHPWCRMMCYKVRHRTIRLDVPKSSLFSMHPNDSSSGVFPSNHN